MTTTQGKTLLWPFNFFDGGVADTCGLVPRDPRPGMPYIGSETSRITRCTTQTAKLYSQETTWHQKDSKKSELLARYLYKYEPLFINENLQKFLKILPTTRQNEGFSCWSQFLRNRGTF
jgi:hypothetical protein